MDKTPEIRFAYLKDVLYHPSRAKLNLEELSPDYRKLGQGLQCLADWVKESNEFAQALAKGDLSKTPPSVENMLAAPMKSLQASLRHLAWQTQQVAKGDFTQRVDFMGEFSEAFNTMTEQLAEQRQALTQEKQRIEEMNHDLKQSLDLMLALTNYTHNMIFVIAAKDQKLLLQNQPAEWFCQTNPDNAKLLWNHLIKERPAEDGHSLVWEFALPTETPEEFIFYSAESYSINWAGTPAIVHMLMDDTQRKKRENLIYKMAYVDPLTGLNNRRYGVEQIERLKKANKPFLLTMVDVDYLKYCNDTFGHEKGDEYLKNIASLLSTLRCDVCRVGGDEFYLLAEGEDLERHDQQISHLRDLLIQQKGTPYPQSFSFGTVAVGSHDQSPVECILREADRKMYAYKRANDRSLSNLKHQDNRI